MKVHLNQIPNEGLHIEGEEPKDILELDADRIIRPVGGVRYALDVNTSGNSFFATGSLDVDLDCECVRCAEKFRYPLSVPNFAMQEDLNGAQTVDLTPAMREDILLALPSYPHCDWSGEKVCEGPRLQPAEQSATPDHDKPSAWDELTKLKIKSR
jgi:uncharacterized metal-binding protein YceD (DUF177 family)